LIARRPCGTQRGLLPLLPSGPGGVCNLLLRRTRLSTSFFNSLHPISRTWRRGWDSNPRGFRPPLFESGALNLSATSPPSSRPLRLPPLKWRSSNPIPLSGKGFSSLLHFILKSFNLAEREGCARSLCSLRLPPLRRRSSNPIPLSGKGFSSLLHFILKSFNLAEREGFEPSIPF
jgi:hypothetical protein